MKIGYIFWIYVFIFSYILLIGFLFAGYMHNEYQEVYIDGYDPKNPLKFGHLNITKGVKWTSDFIVNSGDTPHEKTMKYMKFISENIEFTTPSPKVLPHPHMILDDKKGLCGDYSILLTAFLTTQDIPARVIGLYGYNNSAHVVVEVYYNNSWHMYDPTYEAYWVCNGTILSFDDLKDLNYCNDVELVVYGSRIDRQYLFKELYQYVHPSGEIGINKPMWWDLYIDTYVNNTFVVSDGYRGGSGYIGATYINNNQNWHLINLTPYSNYWFIIYPKVIWGSDIFILHSNFGDYIIKNDDIHPIYISFTTSYDDDENIMLWHDYNETDVVMMIEKYKLVEVQHVQSNDTASVV